jgi:hypothetical protein
MRGSELQALTDEGLKREYKYLELQAARQDHYAEIMRHPEGKFLAEEFKTRRERVRNLYACIDVQKEGATHLLAALQAYEREANEWINRLIGGREQSDEVGERMKAITDLLEQRKKAAQDTTFVPTGHTMKG